MTITWVHKPYPHNPSSTHATLFSLFVFLFLTIFQPFGIRGMPGPFLGVTAGFGAVTAGVMVLLNVLVPQLLPAPCKLARERRSRATYEKSAETLTDALPQHSTDAGGTLTLPLPAGGEPLTLLTSELRYLQN